MFNYINSYSYVCWIAYVFSYVRRDIMLIEFKGICGEKILINIMDIQYAYGMKYADDKWHTTVQFKNGKKIFLWNDYEDFKAKLKSNIERKVVL